MDNLENKTNTSFVKMGIRVKAPNGDIVSRYNSVKRDIQAANRISYRMIQRHNWYNKSVRYLIKRNIRLNYFKYNKKHPSN